MKKNIILNNKGFVLAETLIVAVAITLIFTLCFQIFYPLMGEYEIRENYDDIDSKYGTYWIKKILQSNDYNFSYVDGEINSKGYAQFSCEKMNNTSNKAMCYELINKLEVSCDENANDDYVNICTASSSSKPHIYITKFSFSVKDASGKSTPVYKEKIYKQNGVPEDVKNYIKFLPEYSKVVSLNGAQYRVIIEYYRHRFDTPFYNGSTTQYVLDTDNDFKTYSNIEIRRN